MDLERDSAIVKVVSEGHGWRTTTDINYQQTSGVWLPREWTRKATFEGKPRLCDQVEVKTAAVSPPITDKDFTFEPTLGMYVQDEMYSRNSKDGQLTGSSKYYRLETDGRRTELNEYLYPLR